MPTFTKDNPPADNDYSPSAIKYRDSLKDPSEREPDEDTPKVAQGLRSVSGQVVGEANPPVRPEGESDLSPAPTHFDK